MQTCENPKCEDHMKFLVDDKYCGKCGMKTVIAPQCVCGEPINVDTNFCEECGRPTK